MRDDLRNWTYVIPIVIIGVFVFITVKENKKYFIKDNYYEKRKWSNKV
jgi:hypothetical protein